MKNIPDQSIKLNSSQGSQNRHTRRTLNRPAVQKMRKRMTIRLIRSVNREGPSQPLSPKVRRAVWGRWGGRIRTSRTSLTRPAHVRVVHRAAPRQHPRHRTTSGNAGAGSGSGSGNNDGDGGSDGEPPRSIILLDYSDLSALLKVAVGTLKNRYSRNPETLPPAIHVPGARGPRWLLSTVLAWLKSHETASEGHSPFTPAPKRKGRPRIAQAGKGGASC